MQSELILVGIELGIGFSTGLFAGLMGPLLYSGAKGAFPRHEAPIYIGITGGLFGIGYAALNILWFGNVPNMTTVGYIAGFGLGTCIVVYGKEILGEVIMEELRSPTTLQDGGDYRFIEDHFDTLYKWGPIATTVATAAVGLISMYLHGSFDRAGDFIANFQKYSGIYKSEVWQFGWTYILGGYDLDVPHALSNVFSFVLIPWSPIAGSIVKENILDKIRYERNLPIRNPSNS